MRRTNDELRDVALAALGNLRAVLEYDLDRARRHRLDVALDLADQLCGVRSALAAPRLGLGLLIYFGYSRSHSLLGKKA